MLLKRGEEIIEKSKSVNVWYVSGTSKAKPLFVHSILIMAVFLRYVY